MLTLGIETSCDETSVSLTERRRVMANVVSSSVHLHQKYGGVVPEIASRYHVEYIIDALDAALKRSRRKLDDVDLISVTGGPGLVGALLIGISLAKSLSLSLKVPVIGVNHVLAHLYSAFLSEGPAPRFPFIGLVVSGGHTALYYCKGIGDQKLLGQTQDDAIGEAYDKVAKILGLGYPGGPAVDRMARMAERKTMIRFPKSFMGKDSLDFSFSGIKTAVLYYVRDVAGKGGAKLPDGVIADICYAFQESALDVLIEKTCLAAEMKKARTIVVGGGVAANSRLREKLGELAKRGNYKVYFPDKEYCMDNAAMIGVLGEELYRQGERSDLYLSAQPNLEAC